MVKPGEDMPFEVSVGLPDDARPGDIFLVTSRRAIPLWADARKPPSNIWKSSM
jgi:hypothetical protein